MSLRFLFKSIIGSCFRLSVTSSWALPRVTFGTSTAELVYLNTSFSQFPKNWESLFACSWRLQPGRAHFNSSHCFIVYLSISSLRVCCKKKYISIVSRQQSPRRFLLSRLLRDTGLWQIITLKFDASHMRATRYPARFASGDRYCPAGNHPTATLFASLYTIELSHCSLTLLNMAFCFKGTESET